MLLQKLLVYAVLGLVIENLFTGLGAALQKNWNLTTRSYLWMLPIYGAAGLSFDFIHGIVSNHWLHAPIYVVLIYVIEFCSGWVLEKLLGKCPWHYGYGKNTLMGYIRWDYAPFWLLLALAFDPLSKFLHLCLQKVTI